MRACTGCGRLLDLANFSPRSDGYGGGYYSRCKRCVASKRRKAAIQHDPSIMCCHGILGPSPCTRIATHKCPYHGIWRACDEHRLQGDEPLLQSEP